MEYEYWLPHSDIEDVPKGLFQAFQKGYVEEQDYPRLRDILLEVKMKKEAFLIGDKIAELEEV